MDSSLGITKYNQQDATLHNVFISTQCSTYFSRFLRPSSGAHNCTYSIGYLSNLYCYLTLSWMTHPRLRQVTVKFWQIPNAVCTVVSSWWWAEEPPETCRPFLFNICGSVHHALYWWNKSNKMQQLRFLFAMALFYMFRVTISPIIRSTYAVYGHR